MRFMTIEELQTDNWSEQLESILEALEIDETEDSLEDLRDWKA